MARFAGFSFDTYDMAEAKEIKEAPKLCLRVGRSQGQALRVLIKNSFRNPAASNDNRSLTKTIFYQKP
jgi:hypothetical protein